MVNTKHSPNLRMSGDHGLTLNESRLLFAVHVWTAAYGCLSAVLPSFTFTIVQVSGIKGLNYFRMVSIPRT